jgi:hypothetical protein
VHRQPQSRDSGDWRDGGTLPEIFPTTSAHYVTLVIGVGPALNHENCIPAGTATQRIGALYLSRSPSPFGVRTAVTCRRAPIPLGCGRLRMPGDCWRRVWALAACALRGEGLLAVPTPWPPVARRLLADPQGLPTPDGGGWGRGHLLDPVAQTPPPASAFRGTGGVCRGHLPVAGQPHWREHQR